MPSEPLKRVFDEIYESFNSVPHTPGSDRRRHPEYTGQLLDHLGHPDRAYPVLMVTGSKGKGSTAYYLSEILRAHGHRVGFFSSPGFLSDLDRIRLDGQAISEEEFLAVWSRIRPAWRTLLDTLPEGHYMGPVGLFAVVAAEYFRSRQVSFAVIETGRGARFDDVAQLSHRYALLTNLLPEHLRELGPTLQDIAWHKLGIVHCETERLFVGSSCPELEEVLGQERPSWPKDLTMTDLSSAIQLEGRVTDTTGTRFDVVLPSGRRIPSLHLPSLGPTVDNFAVALAVSEDLLSGRLDTETVVDLAPSLVWPGRGQILCTSPYILLDASIHHRSAQALLREAGGRFNRVVLSLPLSKDRKGIQQAVEPFADSIVYTTCSNPYLLYEYGDLTIRPQDAIVASVHEALRGSLRGTTSHTRILWLGTVSFVADAYRHLDLGIDVAPPQEVSSVE